MTFEDQFWKGNKDEKYDKKRGKMAIR